MFPPRAQLYDHPLVQDGSLILQVPITLSYWKAIKMAAPKLAGRFKRSRNMGETARNKLSCQNHLKDIEFEHGSRSLNSMTL